MHLGLLVCVQILCTSACRVCSGLVRKEGYLAGTDFLINHSSSSDFHGNVSSQYFDLPGIFYGDSSGVFKPVAL